MYYGYFFAFHLFHVIQVEPLLQRVIKAITTNGKYSCCDDKLYHQLIDCFAIIIGVIYYENDNQCKRIFAQKAVSLLDYFLMLQKCCKSCSFSCCPFKIFTLSFLNYGFIHIHLLEIISHNQRVNQNSE